ncbi:MAG: hypothetical protein EOQ39_07225 [Mesorhizobium sp.]|uniref:hypothetical protein n=1 Tax=Mesorhizobium sp. TaxID=1871066 RepID=UPI000FE7754A|nr:hypothetical protein [Mesorhizobium sp.]RWB05843.1 MAG: hypothetical protein EOQ37_16540 [Mesorhizobium sp.]RWB16318.1 MAG: hypothetical protein EOQ39_07225 [Mesorhizobium sp.]
MSELTLLARLNKRVLHVNIRIGIGVDTDKTLEGHWSESPVSANVFAISRPSLLKLRHPAGRESCGAC